MGQIDKFRAAMSKAKGFARPSKFAVRINPPTLISTIGNGWHKQVKKPVNMRLYVKLVRY